MAGIVDGRVVVVTGAGRGIGREHALAFAAEGAKVVVNDLGCERDGSGADPSVAEAVVEQIRAAGGEAVAHTGDIASWAGGQSVVDAALSAFGTLDVLVNNAGILRDRMLVNMTEDEFDDVVRVHLKGTFATAHAAAAFWRARSEAGEPVDARIISTSSSSGLFGNAGQTHYGAAKAGVASFTIIAAQELARFGVTVNAIAPTALTRMTDDLGFFVDIAQQYREAGFDHFHPGNISPHVVYLGSAQSRGITGRVLSVAGDYLTVLEGWVNGPDAGAGGRRWGADELVDVAPDLVARAAGNAGTLGTRD